MPRVRAKAGRSAPRLPSPYSRPHHPLVEGDLTANANTNTHTPNANDTMSDKATPYQMRQNHHILDAAAAQRDNAVSLALWAREIWQKIKEVPPAMNIDDYLKLFIPSNESVPLPACPPVGSSFRNIGEGGAERMMYTPLVRALTRLMKKFPAKIRPKFHNYDHTEMKFPFELHAKDQHPTMPDVIATIPSLCLVAPLYRWRHVALVFELKARREEDPMLRETATHWRTLI
ncbi:hypothetical protein FOMPIDRAFT_1056364 [Fomitopsis schrenkii]|uniref:Fungal-type protein kinase domain-containing protein n=1 Tax=Fomitopsis schrenkii TaxID=2126942 RepID=S8DNU8_FOMSC|nr:hypothetical protein FOMPIDRAFT_1056364 [Fomitopsis schrenkii]